MLLADGAVGTLVGPQEMGLLGLLHQKIIQVQWNLDLVTIYLVTTHDLVTLFGMTSFLLSKIHRFSDILLIC